jgi:hypothetical protein
MKNQKETVMNQEIRKLQVLNDLIALTLDTLQQRPMLGAPTPFTSVPAGLSHTPYAVDPRFSTFGAPVWQQPVGLSHTSYGRPYGYINNIPAWQGMGAVQTPFVQPSFIDPRFVQYGW